MGGEVSSDEAFQIEYRTFIGAIETLSQPPEMQCKSMGNINVAWELKDDLAAGSFLLENPSSILSESHKIEIEKIIRGLNKLPKEILKAANTFEANFEAMSHPAWEPLREMAAKLLNKLNINTGNNG